MMILPDSETGKHRLSGSGIQKTQLFLILKTDATYWLLIV